MNEIEAFIYGKKIGTLIEHNGVIYFEYDKSFKQENIEISPLKLKVKNGLYTNKDYPSLYNGLAGVFFDSLPDIHGMEFINNYFLHKEVKPNEITLLHKLAFIGNRGMGAIEYRPSEHDQSALKSKVCDAKAEYEKLKENIQNKNSSIQDFLNMLDSVSPVGGGRPKMLIEYNPATKTIKTNSNTLENGYKRAIIKFDEIYKGVGSINLTKLEYIAMSMAKNIGIATADFELLEDNSSHHLVVNRFDRDKNDEKIHMVTASSLLHKDISIPQSSSYEELFMLCNAICKNYEDIEELFRRMVLNVLILNYDDHFKNFSFLMTKDGKWRLSPAYDITYSKGLAKQHLTTIKGKALNITREDLLSIAKSYSIKQNIAEKIIENTINEVQTFEQKAKKLDFTQVDILEYVNEIKKCVEFLE